MKKNVLVLLAIVILGSCSTPKYAYYFDHQNYYAGKKQSAVKEMDQPAIDPYLLVASTSSQPVILADMPAASTPRVYSEMSKRERKELRHQLKREIKNTPQNKHGVTATQAGMDHDLKLAIIFGAVGLVGLIIGGSVFWVVGGIALLIGVVFFVKWIIRQ